MTCVVTENIMHEGCTVIAADVQLDEAKRISRAHRHADDCIIQVWEAGIRVRSFYFNTSDDRWMVFGPDGVAVPEAT